jgi:release factor glutamine methyltransferase
MPSTRRNWKNNLGKLDDNIQYLKKLEAELKQARVPSPRAEAEMLLQHFGRMAKMALFTGQKAITSEIWSVIQDALKERKKGKPVQQVLGQGHFYGRDFEVNKHTLIPRPETEVLLEEALRLIKERGEKPTQILDIGTGSGCIAISLTLENPACRMTALDVSPQALKVARRNAKRLGAARGIRFVKSGLFGAFGRKKQGFWDLIVSNPPYIPREDWKSLPKEVRREPRLALDGGPGGLKVIGQILKEAPEYLKDGGWLVLEIGDGQSVELRKILKKHEAFADFHFVKDLNGIDRVMVARKNG